MTTIYLLFLLIVALAQAKCPSNSFEHGNYCYLFYTDVTTSLDAEVTCNQFAGNLASIHDGFLNTLITSEGIKYLHESTVADFWIGLNQLVTPGNWTWTDNSTYDFTELPKQSQNFSLNCVAMTLNTGLWKADDCLKAKPFVCEFPKVITTPYPNWENCSKDWVYFAPTHSCYGNEVGSYTLNWTLAEKRCMEFGAHLPSVHSFAEGSFLSAIGKQPNENLWTGLYSNDNEKTWQWTDGSPVDYLLWFQGQPHRNVSSVAVIYQTYLYDHPNTDVYYFVCKKPAP